MTAMSEAEIKAGLAKLDPKTPWAHHFDLGHGIETVLPEVGQFYRKAIGLKEFGELFPAVLRGYMGGRQSFEGLRCLDLGAAEGIHSIGMAQRGAKEVVGIEGRQLYVDRASFIAKAKGLDNVRFQLGDVRKLPPSLGQFDFVLCSGLLHHLDRDAFIPFTKSLFDLTGDTLLLYTHVSSEWVDKKFKLKPTDPVAGVYSGSLFQEHAEDSSQAERTKQVRASLDNVYSFWAREDALMQRFVEVGFKSIVKLYEPAFVKTYTERVFRGIWVLRRNAP